MTADLRAELRGVAVLLRRYGPRDRADFVDQLADESDDERLLSLAAGLELWGGSGAVWEVEPFQYACPDDSSSESAYAEFQRAMIRVAELLEVRGLGSLARRNADLFRRELDQR